MDKFVTEELKVELGQEEGANNNVDNSVTEVVDKEHIFLEPNKIKSLDKITSVVHDASSKELDPSTGQKSEDETSSLNKSTLLETGKKRAYVTPNNHVLPELSESQNEIETVPIVIFYPPPAGFAENSDSANSTAGMIRTIQRQDGQSVPMIAKTIKVPLDVATSMFRSSLNASLRNRSAAEVAKRARPNEEQ